MQNANCWHFVDIFSENGRVVERCRVSPPEGAAEELCLPLTFFDMFWLELPPIQRILFYKFRCSNSQFIDTIIPTIKRSLAIALKHFLPFAGHFVYPSAPENKPEIRYRRGDSVPVTFTESNDEFDYYIGNHPRDADKFYQFLPQLPPTVAGASNSRLIPILAVQLTLFPGLGICVGLTNRHVVGDARSTVIFIRTWTSICRHGCDDTQLSSSKLLPLHDRCLIKDPNGELAQKYWNELRSVHLHESEPFIISEGKIRATFVIDEARIQELKNLVLNAKGTDLNFHVSTFTVVCGFMWSCLAKAGACIGENEGMDQFIVAADFRARLDPPLPENYFGNCIGPCFAESTRSRLIGEDGFLIGAELIGKAIHEGFMRGKEHALVMVRIGPGL